MRQENVVDTLVSAPNQGNTTIFACHLLQNWLARNIPYLQKTFHFNIQPINHSSQEPQMINRPTNSQVVQHV